MTQREPDGEPRRLFGTDGVRGVANVHPMTGEMAMQLGRALAFKVRRSGDPRRNVRGAPRHRIVIGKDTRISGYLLEQAIASGICSMGVDVMLCGPLPTPGIAFITESMRADAGVVISASHNPYQDNGIKFFGRDGFKLPDATEREIEDLIFGQGPEFRDFRPIATEIGKAVRIDDAVGRYIVFLKSLIPDQMTLDGLKIVVDCANGAAYKTAPAVFEELGARVVRMNVRPDGLNINEECGAVHPESMARAVKKHGADLGIALDGDADRLIVADEKGRIVDGDAIMAVVARALLARRRLAKKTVVATVMSNIGLERSLAEVGGRVVRTAVGDRYVVEEMRRHGYNFGGEQSGHLIFLDSATTGDGVCAALALLAVMRDASAPVSRLVKVFEPVPQVLQNLVVKERRPLGSLPDVTRAIEAVERSLGKQGRVFVRYSGTENKVRVLVEGPNARKIAAHAERIVEALRRAVG
jgi:phosphoglucosamine mutase